jgi:hypothetical protein
MIVEIFYIGIVLFLITLLYFIITRHCDKLELFQNNKEESKDTSCPNILLKKGNIYLLQNTKQQMVPGVNPIQFNNLDEYDEFIKWQRSQNINCPVLYLEYAYNTQDQPVYFVSPNPPFSGNVSMPEYTPRFKDELCNSK